VTRKLVNLLYIEDQIEDDFKKLLDEEYFELDKEVKLNVEVVKTIASAKEHLCKKNPDILIIDIKLDDKYEDIEGFDWFENEFRNSNFIPVIFYSANLKMIEGYSKIRPLKLIPKGADEENGGLEGLANAIFEIQKSQIQESIQIIQQEIDKIRNNFLWDYLDYDIFQDKDEEFIINYREKLISRIGVTLIADKIWSENIDANKVIIVPPLSRTINCFSEATNNGISKRMILSGEIIKIDEEFMISVSSTCDILNSEIKNVTFCKLKNINQILNIDPTQEISNKKWGRIKDISNHSNPRYYYIPRIPEFEMNEMLVDFNDINQLNKEFLSQKIKENENVIIASLLPPFSDRLLMQFGNYFRIGTPQIAQIQDLDVYKKYREE